MKNLDTITKWLLVALIVFVIGKCAIDISEAPQREHEAKMRRLQQQEARLQREIATPPIEKNGSAVRFFESINYGRTLGKAAIQSLGAPDAVLLLHTDQHPRAKEWREYLASGDDTFKEWFWHNEGCQPVILSLDENGKINGADFSYYRIGCIEGLDEYVDMPAEYSCGHPDRSAYCQ